MDGCAAGQCAGACTHAYRRMLLARWDTNRCVRAAAPHKQDDSYTPRQHAGMSKFDVNTERSTLAVSCRTRGRAKSTFDAFKMRRALFIKLFESICELFRLGECRLQSCVGGRPEASVNGNTVVLSDLQQALQA
jgi:hypothetical protein